MGGHGEILTRKPEMTIAAMLTASTLTEAAHAASDSELTMWRWLQRKDFKRLIDRPSARRSRRPWLICSGRLVKPLPLYAW